MSPKPRHALEWLVCHAFVGGCFVLPLALGMAYEAGTLGFEVDQPAERTATYMASMSLIPFPDADAEVLEVTEELMEPPSSAESATDGESEGTETPLEQNSDAGDAPTEGKPKATPTADDVEQVKSGGKTKGPTQDGDGSKAQECLPDNPDIQVGRKASTWRVKRDLVDHYTGHLREAATLADTYWQRGKEGEIVGFRVKRIRCGNDLYQMGFRGNDVVRSVNGETVTSIPQAIKAYRKLRNDKKLTVVIRRNKQEMTLNYVLVD